jgi:hypothetical protein
MNIWFYQLCRQKIKKSAGYTSNQLISPKKWKKNLDVTITIVALTYGVHRIFVPPMLNEAS